MLSRESTIRPEPPTASAFSCARTRPGAMDFPAIEQTLLCVHLGAPAKLACRRDRRRYAGTSVDGDIDIIPACTSMRWQMFDQNVNTLVLTRPPSLLTSIAATLDMDNRRVEIRNRFQMRDLGWLCWTGR